VVCFLGINDEAGRVRDRKNGDPCRDGGRVLTGLTLRRPKIG
jgi:hypothetical protein